MFKCSAHRSNCHNPFASVIFGAVAASLLLASSFGQESTSQPPAGDVVNVNEVVVDLSVRDRKNKPVLDLAPGDIAIADNGTPVKISALHLVNSESSQDHLITLVFDPLEPSAAGNARDVIKKILKVIPTAGFAFSVVQVDGRLRLFQQFTSNRAAVDQAINEATDVDNPDKTKETAQPEKELISAAQKGVDLSGASVSANDRTTAQVMLAALEDSQRLAQNQKTNATFAGLLALARAQRKLPGRKVIIYFTQGFPQSDANVADAVRSISAAANRSGVSIFVIDKDAIDAKMREGLIQTNAVGAVQTNNALNPPPTGPAAQFPRAYGPGMTTQIGDTLSRFENDGLSGSKDPMENLGSSTGGAYIASEDNLKKHIRQLVDDLNSYYVASYAPPTENYDGKFRPIAVKPLRGGLKIHARAGYFALPPDSGTAIRPFELPLLKMLDESQLPTDLKFNSSILRLGDLPDGNENALVLEVPVSELETHDDPNSNLYSLHLSLVAQVKNKAGVVIEHFSEDVPRHGSLDSKGSAESEMITMQRHFAADPGDYILEAAILDRNSGRAGAQRVEFSIPNADTGPSLSDLALVRSVEPIPAAETDTAEPLRYGSGKVIPSISGYVPRGSKQISFFFEVHPDLDSKELPRLEMEVLKDSESIAQVPLQLRKASGPVTIPYMASIQSAALPSGNYQVIERLTQGGKTFERALAFKIDGSELAEAMGPGAPAASSASETGEATVAPPSAMEGKGHEARGLVITALPAGAVPPPSAEQMQSIVEAARKRALEYMKSLPNFICVESTDRSVDQSGNGHWKHRDSLAEMLTYHGGQETRTTLAVNGARSSLKRTEMNSSWPLSVGEFGGLLDLLFEPSSKTHFEWKEEGTLNDGTGSVQVLSYRVARENATIDLSQGNDTIGVGFHGLVYIDSATSGIRRITVDADDLPHTFSMRGASMIVDYGYVTIAARDYLVPIRSTVSLQRPRGKVELNEMAFWNYRRFASRTKIKVVQ